MAAAETQSHGRIEAYDLARFFAIVGMVLVNYKVVLAYGDSSDSWHMVLANYFTGRAAALFVILAGIGLHLLNHKRTILRRAVFLLVIGYLWQLQWSGDILHYYGFYLLIGAMCLQLSANKLFLLSLATMLLFPVLLLAFEGTNFAYGHGWNWTNLEYQEFWIPLGQLRNLLFNGWHPLIPWLGFLFLGLGLAKKNFHRPEVYKPSLFVSAFAFFLSLQLSAQLSAIEDSRSVAAQIGSWWMAPKAVWGISSIPPGPLYMISASSSAVFVLSASLWLCSSSFILKMLHPLAQAGKMALSFYLFHILFGLHDFEQLKPFTDENLNHRGGLVLWRWVFFSIGAVVFAKIWYSKFRYGPMEWLMRKFS